MTDAPEPRPCLFLVSYPPSLPLVAAPRRSGTIAHSNISHTSFITYLILNVFAHQELLPYVPKKKRKHMDHLTFPILRAMNLCATSVLTRISR